MYILAIGIALLIIFILVLSYYMYRLSSDEGNDEPLLTNLLSFRNDEEGKEYSLI
jgi:hypothetical protein